MRKMYEQRQSDVILFNIYEQCSTEKYLFTKSEHYSPERTSQQQFTVILGNRKMGRQIVKARSKKTHTKWEWVKRFEKWVSSIFLIGIGIYRYRQKL